MDKRCLGDTFGDFDRKFCVGEISFPDSTSADSTATVYRCAQRSDQLSCHPEGSEKKKRVSKIVGGGLRQFSIIVCKKVASKGRTTYSEVADEIIAEFSAREDDISPVSLDEFDEKNIQRRVYDAINVLMALDIISKDRKEIQWKGLRITNVTDMEHTKALRVKLMNWKESILLERNRRTDCRTPGSEVAKSGIAQFRNCPFCRDSPAIYTSSNKPRCDGGDRDF